MSYFNRYTLKYITDLDEEITIIVQYINVINISPELRLQIGGFSLERDSENCALVTPRRTLIPRYISYDTNNIATNRLDVIVKTKQTFQNLIDEPQQPDFGIAKRYYGEQNAICLN